MTPLGNKEYASTVEQFISCYQDFVGYPVEERLFLEAEAAKDAYYEMYAKPSLWSHPFAKTGLISAGSLAATLLVGLFLSEGISNQPISAQEYNPQPQADSDSANQKSGLAQVSSQPTPTPPESIESSTSQLERETRKDLLTQQIRPQSQQMKQLIDNLLMMEINSNRGRSPSASPQSQTHSSRSGTNPSTSSVAGRALAFNAATPAPTLPRPTTASQGLPILVPNVSPPEIQQLDINAENSPTSVHSQATASPNSTTSSQGNLQQADPLSTLASLSRPQADAAPGSQGAIANVSPPETSPSIVVETIPTPSTDRTLPEGSRLSLAAPAPVVPTNLGISSPQTSPTLERFADLGQTSSIADLKVNQAKVKSDRSRTNRATPGTSTPELDDQPFVVPILQSLSQLTSAGSDQETTSQSLTPTSVTRQTPSGTAPSTTATNSPQSLRQLLNRSQQTFSGKTNLVPLSYQAAVEAASSTQIGQFHVFRLSPQDYQKVWSARASETTNTARHGFVDYQRQMIVMPAIPSS